MSTTFIIVKNDQRIEVDEGGMVINLDSEDYQEVAFRNNQGKYFHIRASIWTLNRLLIRYNLPRKCWKMLENIEN